MRIITCAGYYATGSSAVTVLNYTDTNVSEKFVKIIQSYTGVVNKMVWRK